MVDDSGNEWSQPKKLESATAFVEDGQSATVPPRLMQPKPGKKDFSVAQRCANLNCGLWVLDSRRNAEWGSELRNTCNASSL